MPDPIDLADELQDVEEATSFNLARVDSALLSSPVVLRAAGGIVIGLAVLLWPDRSNLILSRLVGVALVWLAISTLRGAFSVEHRRRMAVVRSLGLLLAGLVLMVNPERSTVTLGRLLGLALIVYATFLVYGILRSPAHDWGRLTFAGILASAGAALIVVTEDVISTVIAVGAIWWITVSAVSLVASLDARTPGAATYGETGQLVLAWVHERPKSVDARQTLYDKILYEGPTTRTRVIRFFTLMAFASIIASMGIITDSTAVVIGAMLVAPLMTPLMGMAISLVMGWPNRLTRSTIVAFGGILFAITIGVLCGLISPTIIDTSINTQILARTSPTSLDLITAMAAGAAGAYGLSRPDVSDSLPGVAIAISLVPPLAVVGIAISQGDVGAAMGALLLFATNMVAILIIGGLTFVVTGVTPLARVAENQQRVRTAIGVTLTGAIVVFGALLFNGGQITADAFQQSTVEQTVNDWLPADTGHRLVSVELIRDDVNAVIVGPSSGLPDLDILAAQLSTELDRTVTTNISLVVEERLTSGG